jgi:kynurenine formamidase
MKIVDLSGAIENGLWTYGSPNPEVKVTTLASIEKQGFEVSALEMSILTGSYIETSSHLVKHRPSLDEMPLDRFISTATVVKLPKSALEPITAADLASNKTQIYKNPTLIIGTGWDAQWNTKEYLSKSPFFTVEAMEWLAASLVNLLAADIPVYNDPRGRQVNVLHIYYRKERNMIVAPLVNIGGIAGSEVKLLTIPIKLKGQCAAPCRIFALEK